ncbi:MAG TPA: UDP-N-acetylmuramate dehydrogenase [Armatimonadota bacterium]|nr:UDP-N-acetylmuramate dehydrogenase [Armatimonadota bacterium]
MSQGPTTTEGIDGPPRGDHQQRIAVAVERLQRESGLDIRLNEPMVEHTSLGVGGPAEVFADVLSVDGVVSAVDVARECGIPLTVCGRGTNLLVLDGGILGVVLHLGEGFRGIERKDLRVVAEGGASLAEVCEFAASHGLSGLEFAAGVPGAVGGAAAMNAGAGDGQMADVVESVQVVHENGDIALCCRTELEFGYRKSCLRERKCVAARVTFCLTEGDPAQIRKAVFEAVETRCQKQPLSLGSCGSVFKRPEGDYAGRLLEVAGVKGLKIGGACFSKKHANFILNEDNAAARDIVDLIEAAKKRVREHSGVDLEEEVCIIGQSPKE